VQAHEDVHAHGHGVGHEVGRQEDLRDVPEVRQQKSSNDVQVGWGAQEVRLRHAGGARGAVEVRVRKVLA